jgi:DNA-binding transcriptional LysR family regulator
MLHSRMLRYLDEVARAGSIRQASLRLNVAASAINRQIMMLEAEMGGQIFERLPRGLRLTAMGEILIGHVRQTLSQFEQTTNQIAHLKGLLRGNVTIAVLSGLAAGLLGEALLRFRAAHPWVRLTVRVMTREELVQAVLSGEADLGMGYNLESSPRLMVVARIEQRLGAVVSVEHPLAARGALRITDCLTYPLVVADRGMSLRQTTEQLVPAHVDLRPAVETSSTELMKQLAMVPPHVAILNHADVRLDLARGQLVFLPFVERAGHQTITVVHRATGLPEAGVSIVAREIEHVLREIPEA